LILPLPVFDAVVLPFTPVSVCRRLNCYGSGGSGHDPSPIPYSRLFPPITLPPLIGLSGFLSVPKRGSYFFFSLVCTLDPYLSFLPFLVSNAFPSTLDCVFPFQT